MLVLLSSLVVGGHNGPLRLSAHEVCFTTQICSLEFHLCVAGSSVYPGCLHARIGLISSWRESPLTSLWKGRTVIAGRVSKDPCGTSAGPDGWKVLIEQTIAKLKRRVVEAGDRKT